MSRYTLSDFNKILASNNYGSLSDETIKVINSLVSQVGAPEYVKTPQFKNRNIVSSGVRRRKKTQEIADDDWDTIRSFQATEFEKKEGIEKTIDLIRKYLNMITPDTYSKLKDNIETEISIINSASNKDDLITTVNEIFKIVTTNILYSDIYSNLYKDLINKFDIFRETLFYYFHKIYYNLPLDYNI